MCSATDTYTQNKHQYWTKLDIRKVRMKNLLAGKNEHSGKDLLGPALWLALSPVKFLFLNVKKKKPKYFFAMVSSIQVVNGENLTVPVEIESAINRTSDSELEIATRNPDWSSLNISK